MIEECAQLVDLRRSRANFNLCATDVFAILPASGIRTVGRRHKGKRSVNAVLFHLPQGFRQHGMPVTVSPIHRQLRTVLRQFLLQSRDQFPNLLVDRALAAEVVIVLGDCQHAFAPNIPSSQHVFEEWDHLFRRFRAAEGNNENGVVIHEGGSTMARGRIAKNGAKSALGQDDPERSRFGKLGG